MRKLMLAVALLLGLAQYCDGKDVLVAGGGGFILTPDDLWLEVLKLGPSYTYNGTYDDRKKLVDVLTARFFLAEEAGRRGFGEEGLAEELASAEATALEEAYHRWKVEKAVRVPRVASKPVLDNLDRRLHLKEMIFAVHPVAEEALGDMRAGVSFEEMVTRVQGRGDITVRDRGWELWRDIDRQAAYEVFQLGVGGMTGIVPGKAGYSIFYLAEDAPWGESAELIYLRSRRFVRGVKEAELIRQERDELRRMYRVTYSEKGVGAALGAFAIAFGGSRPPDSLLAQDLVTYRGGGLNVAYLVAFYFSLPAPSQPYVGDAHAIRESALDMIMPHLEAAAGRAMGLGRLPEVIWSVKKTREEFLMPKMEEYFRGQITLGPDDPLNYYNEHRSKLVTQKVYRARRILVDSQESARAVMKELRSGRDFAEVAQEKSLDAYSASRGGDTGQIVSGMIAAYDSVLVGMKLGDVTRPFSTADGIEILKLEEMSESRPLTFEEAREAVDGMLINEKANQLLATWVGARQQEVGYRFNEGVLKRINLPEPAWKAAVAKTGRVQEESGD